VNVVYTSRLLHTRHCTALACSIAGTMVAAAAGAARHASCRGDQPSLSATWQLAPARSSAATTSGCPFSAAACKAVAPWLRPWLYCSSDAAFGPADDSKFSTVARSPQRLAKNNCFPAELNTEPIGLRRLYDQIL
jgi:hypothetical protein